MCIEDIATLKADMSTVKSQIKDIRSDIKEFITKADNNYATKREVEDVKKIVTNNTNRLWQLSKEVSQWGVLIALISKLVGLW